MLPQNRSKILINLLSNGLYKVALLNYYNRTKQEAQYQYGIFLNSRIWFWSIVSMVLIVTLIIELA